MSANKATQSAQRLAFSCKAPKEREARTEGLVNCNVRVNQHRDDLQACLGAWPELNARMG
jgi:hypothetical protein